MVRARGLRRGGGMWAVERVECGAEGGGGEYRGRGRRGGGG